MNSFDFNDRVITAVGNGMAAAADRFGQRMDEIREGRFEQKASQTYFAIAHELAKQVDEQTDQLKVLQNHARAQAAELSAKNNDLALAKSQMSQALRHIEAVSNRLLKVEDILQRQSAHTFALDEFRKIALEEIQNGMASTNVLYKDSVKRQSFFEAAYNSFMEKTNVKRGVPTPSLTVQNLLYSATALSKTK